MKKINLVIVSLTILLNSCISDFNDSIGLEKISEKLVVNCLFTNDSLWTLQLSNTNSIIGKPNNKIIDYAIIELYNSKNERFTFNYFHNNIYKLNSLPELSEEYTIKILNTEYEDIYATDKIPANEIEILNFEIKDTIINNETNIYNLLISFDFYDDKEQNNYYEITVYQIDTLNFIENQIINISDNNIQNPSIVQGIGISENIYTNLLFSDENFNGEKMNFYFQTEKNYKEKPIYLQLKSCSYNYFQYQLQYAFSISNAGNFFSEPVDAFTNIENGYGIFGAFVSDIKTL